MLQNEVIRLFFSTLLDLRIQISFICTCVTEIQSGIVAKPNCVSVSRELDPFDSLYQQMMGPLILGMHPSRFCTFIR